MKDPNPVRALESIAEVKPTTNPYITQLIHALRRQPDIDVRLFSFREALFGSYDVFHVHWPEVTFGGAKRVGRLTRRTLTSLLMLRLSISRTPIVRTWHNTERPEGISWWDHRLLDAFDKRTRIVIRLNDTTEPDLDVPVHTVPLGHYRDWYEGLPRTESVPGRVSYVGLIRRYKGVESLVSAFRDVTTPGATLSVAGRPSTSELGDTIRELAGDDERISLRLEFIEESDFVREITASALIALPFVHMHNSSTVLAALSLARPVLVPDNVVNRLLAEEVGAGWIHTYEGNLAATDVESALEAGIPAVPPNLEGRDWETGARLHIDAFRAAAGVR